MSILPHGQFTKLRKRRIFPIVKMIYFCQIIEVCLLLIIVDTLIVVTDIWIMTYTYQRRTSHGESLCSTMTQWSSHAIHRDSNDSFSSIHAIHDDSKDSFFSIHAIHHDSKDSFFRFMRFIKTRKTLLTSHVFSSHVTRLL